MTARPHPATSARILPQHSIFGLVLHNIIWCIAWVLMKLIYRTRVVGLENIPRTGPALIASNHLSMLDGFFLYMMIPRRIRFLVWAPYVNNSWVGWILRLGYCIPISENGSPRDLIHSLKLAQEALAAGELVGIFPEGAVSRNGNMMPFKRGMEHILKKAHAPIIPVGMDRLWGSIFSYRFGKLFWKWPRKWRYPMTMIFGKAMPADTPSWKVRQHIQELIADSFNLRKEEHVPVHREFVRRVCRHPFRKCLMEPGSTGRKLNYLETLTGAVCLSRLIGQKVGDNPMVGLLMPTVVGGCVANIAVSLLGKTAVNLNYTASLEAVKSSIQQCKIRHVITSRLFRKKIEDKLPFDFGPDVTLVELEDFAPLITK
ncbi:MAG TPA: 1-acyl-sn-glycerol-3-phosphate acyltransferase, partial [Gemmatales bacterium]|nr:1-acyl-sn-glycerol-3-phosphate acyltransferase [Gemmatales bacterium]